MLAHRQNGTYMIIGQDEYSALVVDVASVKKQLNITHSEDDDMIEDLIGAAQELYQNMTGLFINRQTVIYKTDCWLDEFCLSRGPWPDLLAANVQMAYYNSDNDNTEFTDFDSYINNNTLRVRPLSQPNLYKRGDAVLIQFDCGWSTVPQDVKRAIIILAAHLYNNRDIVIVGASVSQELPFTITSLINMRKVQVI